MQPIVMKKSSQSCKDMRFFPSQWNLPLLFFLGDEFMRNNYRAEKTNGLASRADGKGLHSFDSDLDTLEILNKKISLVWTSTGGNSFVTDIETVVKVTPDRRQVQRNSRFLRESEFYNMSGENGRC